MAQTILLIQGDANPLSRMYAVYESVNDCMQGVCRIYEEHLKREDVYAKKISFSLSQLFDFVDELSDVSLLVFDKVTKTFAPYDKEWIKEQLYLGLRSTVKSLQ